MLEEINNERENLRVVKLNTDDNPETAAAFEVLSIPTLILFKAGEPVKKVIGAYPKKRLEASSNRSSRPSVRAALDPPAGQPARGAPGARARRVGTASLEAQPLAAQPPAHPLRVVEGRRRDGPVGLEHAMRARAARPG